MNQDILILDRSFYDQMFSKLSERGETQSVSLLAGIKNSAEVTTVRQVRQMLDEEAIYIASLSLKGHHNQISMLDQQWSIERMEPVMSLNQTGFGLRVHLISQTSKDSVVIWDDFDVHTIIDEKDDITYCQREIFTFLLKSGFDVIDTKVAGPVSESVMNGSDSTLEPIVSENRAPENMKIQDEPVVQPLSPVLAVEEKATSKKVPLSDIGKKVISLLKQGGSLHSLRYQDLVFCNTYYNGSAVNIPTDEVVYLINNGLIWGIVQNIYPDKEYELTELGKMIDLN